MTAAVITQRSAGENAANSAYTIPFTVVTGRTLIIQVSYGNAITGITGISDSGGNTWVEEYSDTAPTGHSRKLYRCQTIGTVPTTVTVTGTAGTLAYWIYEVTGLATVAPLESVTTVAGVSGTSHSSAYTTLSAEALVILTAICNSAKGTHTATAPFTGILMSRTTHLGEYLADAGAAGTYSAAYTTSNTVTPQNLMIVYKAFSNDPTVSTVSSNSATEGSSITHTVTLSGSTNRTTYYAASIADVTTTGGTDYDNALGNATYSNGVTFSGGNMVVPTAVSSFTVAIATTADTTDEVDETYTLTVGGVSGTGTITDDDAPPTISVTDASENAMEVVFTVSLSQASGKTITVDYATADGTKTAGTDYTAASGTLTFAAGETTKTVTVAVL